jgi:hypothetical protein
MTKKMNLNDFKFYAQHVPAGFPKRVTNTDIDITEQPIIKLDLQNTVSLYVTNSIQATHQTLGLKKNVSSFNPNYNAVNYTLINSYQRASQ